MTNIVEVFAFPIEILDGPQGERNFEMYRAELRHQPDQQQQPIIDPSFDQLVRRISEPFEVNFEMIHMVDYVRRRVDSNIFDCFPSPFLSAEFWLHHIHQDLLQAQHSPPLPPISRTTVATQTENDEATIFEPPTGPSKMPHRQIPGLNTILQCGTTPAGKDYSVVGSTSVAPYATPLSGRINQLFSDGVTRLWASPETSFVKNQLKENDPPEASPKQTRRAGEMKSPAQSELNRPKWHPFGESVNVASSGTQNLVQHSVKNEIPPKSPVPSKMPFEIFHDSYIHESMPVVRSTAVTVVESSITTVSSYSVCSTGSNAADPRIPSSNPPPCTTAQVAPSLLPSAIDIEAMDDTAIFTLLDQHLAAASTYPRRPGIEIEMLDSPTRIIEPIFKKYRTDRRPQ